MKKILIGGVFYGMHNIGDEAILYSMLRLLSKKYEVDCLSFGSNWLKQYYKYLQILTIPVAYSRPKLGLSVRPRRKIFSNLSKIKKERQILSQYDGYVCGGATILSDCPFHSLKTVENAGKLGKTVILWGVGIADGTDEKTNKYIRTVLNKGYVDKVYVRDEFVLERLKKIGVDEKKLRISYDPAIMLTGERFELCQYLSKEALKLLKNGKENIAFSISGERDVVDKTPIKTIEKIILKLSEKYNVFLIPTGCGEHCKDGTLMKEIVSNCQKDNIIMIEKEFEPSHLVEFLKDFKFIVSSRLHLNIFGACAEVPSIGLVRNSKIIDFATLMGLPYLELENLSVEKTLEILCLLEKQAVEHKQKIAEEVVRMRKQQLEAFEELSMTWLK